MAQIQWFPGHMAKTKRLIQNNLKLIDVVIEVLDARAPRAGTNPLLRQITRSKPRLILLNKCDLADPEATARWEQEFRREGGSLPLKISAATRQGLEAIPGGCRELCANCEWLARRPIRALISGIPNSGKSTIINALAKRNRAQAAAVPGLTRQLQRVPINRQLELFDTPGLLWHKFDTPRTGLILAAIGAIKESILPEEDVSGHILLYLARRYPAALAARYGIDAAALPNSPAALTEAVARRRGCLLPGGAIDHIRVCQLILKDLREAKFGTVSLEWPEEAE
ncbi:MAG: ribosome biogenesis GTPase YlqF [Spirochaeta sp. LUC14_002_19_P3]|nr:MAG: ribosome biogenesis GTPase YlqF [Spirochaeta sp. LUC14_002_19_P3]